MTPFTSYMVNYRQSKGVVRVVDDRMMPIEVIGNLPMRF